MCVPGMQQMMGQMGGKSNLPIAGYNQSGNAGYGDPSNIQFPKGTGAKPGPGYRPPTQPAKPKGMA